MVSSAYPEHYLVGVCNEFRSPSAYWSATAIRHCADQTPEVVWPRGPGRQVSRSTSLHIACPKELEAASRSSKTYLAKTVEEDLRQFNLGLASGLRRAQNRTAWRHSQEQQRHRQAPIDIERRDMVVDILFQRVGWTNRFRLKFYDFLGCLNISVDF